MLGYDVCEQSFAHITRTWQNAVGYGAGSVLGVSVLVCARRFRPAPVEEGEGFVLRGVMSGPGGRFGPTFD